MYIVMDGVVRVEKDGDEVAKVKTGGYFGERALLKVSLLSCLIIEKIVVHVVCYPG